jgi:glyoxylate carboligase
MCGYNYKTCKRGSSFWVQSTVIPQNICVCANHLTAAVRDMSAMAYDAVSEPITTTAISSDHPRVKYHRTDNHALVTVKVIMPHPTLSGSHIYR